MFGLDKKGNNYFIVYGVFVFVLFIIDKQRIGIEKILTILGSSWILTTFYFLLLDFCHEMYIDFRRWYLHVVLKEPYKDIEEIKK